MSGLLYRAAVAYDAPGTRNAGVAAMFSSGSLLDQVAAAAVAQSPAFAVMLCGILFALLRRRRHPKMSLLLAAGLSLVLFDYAASYSDAYGWATNLILGPTRVVVVVSSLASGLVTAVAFALIIAAAFADRVQPRDE
jgi:hypothetical protein